jgi:hypothetical protein
MNTIIAFRHTLATLALTALATTAACTTTVDSEQESTELEVGPTVTYRGIVETTQRGKATTETVSLRLVKIFPIPRTSVLALTNFMGITFETGDYVCRLKDNFYEQDNPRGRLFAAGENNGEYCTQKSDRKRARIAKFQFAYSTADGPKPSIFTLALTFADGTKLTTTQPMSALPQT